MTIIEKITGWINRFNAELTSIQIDIMLWKDRWKERRRKYKGMSEYDMPKAYPK